MADSPNRYGLLAEFDTPADTIRAAEKVRDAGFKRWDVYTPYPVHGLDAAMGLGNSQVGWFTFCLGVTGLTCGFLMIWYQNAYNYPIMVGGKPLFSPWASFPVCYEMTILFGAFGSLFGMLFLNRLPRWSHPLFNSERFRRASNDKFYLCIEAADAKFNDAETRALLESLGGKHLEEVRD
jgi:hypothetical protein